MSSVGTPPMATTRSPAPASPWTLCCWE
uniref:Uncharacterized protein n=1 Tax=Anguilla anguilla TaxID=7936 RepID=A0A0E9RYG9_ANGAN